MTSMLRMLGTVGGSIAIVCAVYAAPFAFITNCGSNDVSIIDIATDRVVATVPVGACPYGVAVSPGGAHAYVTNRDDGSLSVIDATAFRETARIPVGTLPVGVAVDPSGRRVYVANLISDSISVIDAATRAIVATVSVASVPRAPAGVAVHPDGSRIYVTAQWTAPSFSGLVLVVNAATLGIDATIGVGYPDSGIAVDASGARVYVSGLYGGSIVDTATNRAIGKLLPGAEAPLVAVAVNPAGTVVYTSGAYPGGPPPGRFNAVISVDVASGAVTARIPFDQPRGLAANPQGTKVYVANGANAVSVIDTATRTVVANIAVGSGPVALGQFIGPDVPAPTVRNYQGLWWNSPAESESGWGINVAHQGEVIFTTWYTYDLAGDAWWLTMSAFQTADNVFSGTLYETTGPAFNAVPFNPNLVTRTPVGTGTLTFTDPNTGSFAYTVKGIAQTKAITRQVWGTLPTCVWGAQPNLALASNYQDLWWNSPAESESGWGVNFTHQNDIIFATWFTYDYDGTPLWLSGTAFKSGTGAYSGQLLRTTGPPFNAVPFDKNLVTRTPVGTLTLTFANGNAASYAYTVTLPGTSPVTQTKQVTRQVFRAPGTVCQ